MKFLSVILLMGLMACSHAPAPKAHVDAPEVSTPAPEFDPGIQDEAIEALKPIATVIEFINHTQKEKTRNIQALEKVKETVRGQCFQDALLKRSLIQTDGKTNLQVLSEILSADVKVKLSMYRSIKNTIGYTYPLPYNTIHCNRKYHDNMDPCDVASNLAHELTHKMGFSHDYKPNKQRPFSVPYSVGTLIDQCCQEKKQ